MGRRAYPEGLVPEVGTGGLHRVLAPSSRRSGLGPDSSSMIRGSIGHPEKIGNIVAGGQLQKWGFAYRLAANDTKIYLGNSKEDALATMKEYEAFASSKEQVWPVIIINSRVQAHVTNATEFSAKTAYLNPSDNSPTIPLYQLYLKKYVKILEK